MSDFKEYLQEHMQLHAQGIAHSHGHVHVHENQKAVVNRLSRAIGHLEKVKRMVEEGADCSEVLIQLAAVRSALDNTGKVILKDHMRHCMVDAVTAGDEEAIDAFFTLSRTEGIIPAIESSHAVAYGIKLAQKMGKGSILINLSGRGDKDIDFVYEKYGCGEQFTKKYEK